MSSPKTILITGATDGIGLQTSIDLAKQGARVVLHGRSTEKLERARELVERAKPGSVAGTLCFDLASLAAVRDLAKAANALGTIDVLLANAGVFKRKREVTVDGYEATFAVNHLAHVLLVHDMLPALRGKDARIVLVSSVAHGRGTLDLADLQYVKGFDGYAAYARSKLANVLFGVELARRLGPTPTVNSLHPGVVSTNLLREGFGMTGPDSVSEGAETSVYLCLANNVAKETGAYWVRKKKAQPHSLADNRELSARFYEESCAMVGVAPLAPAS